MVLLDIALVLLVLVIIVCLPIFILVDVVKHPYELWVTRRTNESKNTNIVLIYLCAIMDMPLDYICGIINCIGMIYLIAKKGSNCFITGEANFEEEYDKTIFSRITEWLDVNMSFICNAYPAV